MSEKTEQPTPKKLRDARQKGQIAHSKEVPSTAIILGLFGFFTATWEYHLEAFQELLLLPASLYGMPFHDAAKHLFDMLLSKLLTLTLPVLAVTLALGLLFNFIQVGVLFAFESIKPDLKKLNPAQGIKKIFSIKNLIETVKSIFKIVFLSMLIYIVIRDGIPDLLKVPHCGMECLLVVMGAQLKQIMIYSSAAFVIIAADDYFFQKFQYIKDLKMTKDEVKREYKEMDGDPMIKGQRKQLHQEIIQGGMEQQVKKSSVVITNPTHIAVALYYKEGETPLPVVKAMGADLIAKRIIDIAKKEGIPIMQNIPLARGLHAAAEVDQYIPSDLIEAVAEVLRWVQELEQRPR